MHVVLIIPLQGYLLKDMGQRRLMYIFIPLFVRDTGVGNEEIFVNYIEQLVLFFLAVLNFLWNYKIFQRKKNKNKVGL